MVPWGLLSFLSILTIGARRPEDQNHRAQLALMLVLTAFTYRVATSGRLPPINYLTVLDYYTIPNFDYDSHEAHGGSMYDDRPPVTC